MTNVWMDEDAGKRDAYNATLDEQDYWLIYTALDFLELECMSGRDIGDEIDMQDLQKLFKAWKEASNNG